MYAASTQRSRHSSAVIRVLVIRPRRRETGTATAGLASWSSPSSIGAAGDSGGGAVRSGAVSTGQSLGGPQIEAPRAPKFVHPRPRRASGRRQLQPEGVAQAAVAGIADVDRAAAPGAANPAELGHLLRQRGPERAGQVVALLRAAYEDPSERARAVGAWGAIAGIGAASGPVLGGLLVGLISWRAVLRGCSWPWPRCSRAGSPAGSGHGHRCCSACCAVLPGSPG